MAPSWASTGQTEGGFKPFRIALTEAMSAAELAYSRVGQLTGVATPFTDTLLGLARLQARELGLYPR